VAVPLRSLLSSPSSTNSPVRETGWRRSAALVAVRGERRSLGWRRRTLPRRTGKRSASPLPFTSSLLTLSLTSTSFDEEVRFWVRQREVCLSPSPLPPVLPFTDCFLLFSDPRQGSSHRHHQRDSRERSLPPRDGPPRQPRCRSFPHRVCQGALPFPSPGFPLFRASH
jgi:hypothetical protein